MKNEFPDPGFLFDLNSIRGSICNRLDVLREGRVEIVFFCRQVPKSSDPASLTFCGGGIFRLRPSIFGQPVSILDDYRSL